jgi:hypothetical protein
VRADPSPRSSTSRTASVAAVALLVAATLLTACADDDRGAPQGSVPVEDVAPALDWRSLPDEPIQHEGWTFGSCGGTAPIVCVGGASGDGTVELLQYAVDDVDVVQAALDEDDDEQAALEAFAEEYVASFSLSRPEECPGTSVVADGPVALEVGGSPGLRYGFQVLDGTGVVVERSVQWATIDGSALFVAAAGALDPTRACFEPIGEFTPATLEAALPAIDDVIAASILRR